MKRIILYFGADASFHELLHSKGFSRRNSNVLRALAESPEIDITINVQFTTRHDWKTHHRAKRIESENFVGHDIAVTPRIPLSIPGARLLNRALMGRHIQKEVNRLTDGATSKIISWCYWPKGHDVWNTYWKAGPTIFDADHNIIDDPHRRPSQKAEQKMNHIMATVDHFISSSRYMNEWAEHRGKHPSVHLVLNGVDKERFTPLKAHQNPRSTTPTIGYVGQLSQWMDLDALKVLIQSNPSCVFRFAGENHQTSITETLQQFPNVEFLGRVNYSDVPQFLSTVDVGLSVYNTSERMDVNSMKIYEYLSAHLPVLALRTHSNFDSDFRGLLHVADDGQGLCEQLRTILQTPQSTAWHESVDSFLEEASWKARIYPLLNKILGTEQLANS